MGAAQISETFFAQPDVGAERVGGIVENVDNLAIFERAQGSKSLVQRKAGQAVNVPDRCFFARKLPAAQGQQDFSACAVTGVFREGFALREGVFSYVRPLGPC